MLVNEIIEYCQKKNKAYIDYLSCVPEEIQIIRARLSHINKRNEQHYPFNEER